jgi:hypothetical protein
MKESPFKTWLLIASLGVLLAGCGSASKTASRNVKLDEQFVLRPGEEVVVSGADLTIQLKVVGHQTFPNPQPKPLRSSYVELTAALGNAPPRSITVDDNVKIGDYTITVKTADPFRSGDGPRCELVVTRR